MNKTLHRKLTEKHQNAYPPILPGFNGDDRLTIAPAWFSAGYGHEMNMLREAAKDLLQPRPEAIARLLKMAKDI
ncbi:MAG: hypothetical protein ACHQD8_00065 [Chitinophagales bacterium]